MDTIVCIKQVPDTTDIKIDSETNTLIRQGVPCVMNPFDAYTVEEAVRLKEKFGGTARVLTMGPPQAEEALREAVAMGADEGILLSDRVFAGSDTLATASVLAAAIKQLPRCSLIICGKQAIDGDTAQVGPELAEMLGLPLVSYVRKICEIDQKRIKVERLMDDAYDVVESPLPALITVVKEINEPRLPSLKGMMRAKKADFGVWDFEKLGGDSGKYGLTGSPTWVSKIFMPEPRKGGEVFEGSVEEQVEKLAARLKETRLL